MSDKSINSGERLQKVLANAGMGSRREIEGWISAGRIEVNGETAQLGQRVQPSDRIKVDGRPVSSKRLAAPEREVMVYNKPEGELVTRKDPEGRRTVFEHLPRLKHGRWIPVGRLDLNSSGLLLLTTDGELANRLMHPSRQVEREYAVRVMGQVTEDQLKQLTHGVELEDGPARFEEIVESGGDGINRWYHVVIMEGRQREVRRMWEAVGAQVNRLKRVRYGSVMLDSALKVGRWRYLNTPELNELLEAMGLEPEKRQRAPRSGGDDRYSGRTSKDGARQRREDGPKRPWKGRDSEKSKSPWRSDDESGPWKRKPGKKSAPTKRREGTSDPWGRKKR
ncbi:MAG: 23S rRNA pseudouridylate synthase B [endosymbiont of Seepiophila jonesi]|uniref:Pseudouridine synthase n=1 Tax=endosymbiont of Lamellibrachia luymesi TaxID=2200907 RepID=A0A370DRA7_9GAMM|nr:MAG: 23S rRNA pseudouridylate synthase B [endosymbiont of Lamellibrachia luymesi]RDH93135.1 MAG: 23S rRNA pseudouridylate synthase B [endosymbiont of Seepiophila jonesi]